MGGVLKNKDNCAAAPVPVSILWANKMNEVPNSSQAGTSKSGNNASSSSSSKMTKATRPKKMVCLCAPTTHPGSFKCRHHRSIPSASKEALIPTEQPHSADQRKTGRLSSFGRPAAATTHEDENPSESQ